MWYMYDSMYSTIQDRLIMLVLVPSKHKAYRSISCYPHTHTSLSEMLLVYAVCYSITFHMIARSEKFISICSDSQAACKALQTAQNIPIGMAVPMGIEWNFHPPLCRPSGSPDVLEYMEMKVPMSLQRRAPFISLSDQSWLWGSQGQI
jgi:hypothetical protein